MKIKYLLPISALFLLVGCGAPEKASDGRGDSLIPDGPPPPKAIKVKAVEAPPEKEKAEEKRPEVTSSTAYERARHALADVIKAGNDDAIYKNSIQVLSLNPQDALAQNSLGLLHYKRGRILAAQYFFGRALQHNPGSSEIHNNMGLTFLVQKEQAEAIKSFRKALELDPQNASAAGNLGAIYAENRDFIKAGILLEVAARKNSKDYKTLVNYGVALAGQGKSGPAKDAYEQALSINSTGKEALYNLAVLEVEQLKEYRSALDHLNKVKFLGTPDSARSKINALENKAKAGLK